MRISSTHIYLVRRICVIHFFFHRVYTKRFILFGQPQRYFALIYILFSNIILGWRMTRPYINTTITLSRRGSGPSRRRRRPSCSFYQLLRIFHQYGAKYIIDINDHYIIIIIMYYYCTMWFRSLSSFWCTTTKSLSTLCIYIPSCIMPT